MNNNNPKCHVCETTNVSSIENCKECGFTLKYAKGYGVDISDKEQQAYKKQLENAKKEYNSRKKIEEVTTSKVDTRTNNPSRGIPLKSISFILLFMFVSVVTYIYMQQTKSIVVYQNIFNQENHFTVPNNKVKKLLDAQTIDDVVWEEHIIDSDEHSKIGWIKKDDL